MGSVYTNIVLKGPTQAEVVAVLRRHHRTAYVSPTREGVTIVYDKECDDLNEQEVAFLARTFSAELETPAWGVLNYEDVFWYCLARDGRLVDEYNSGPGPPRLRLGDASGGDAVELARAFGRPPQAFIINAALRGQVEQAPTATAIHAEIAAALGLPAQWTLAGFRAVRHGEVDAAPDEFLLVKPESGKSKKR
jgi:hypothetical protein